MDWFLGFASELRRVLKPDGSLVINIGGSWRPGHPVRALCHFEVLIRLVREHGFHLAQEFFWHNPAKLPAPAEWVTVRRIRVKDSVEALWWLSKSTQPKADNRQVLTEYSADMKRLLKRGYRAKERPSGHKITHKFTEQGGAIPPNLLTLGNNDANGYYLTRCAEEKIKPHPARFPVQLPDFFIKFLTEEGDLVLDPFAGSCTTGEAAERLSRRWIGFEPVPDYLDGAPSALKGATSNRNHRHPCPTPTTAARPTGKSLCSESAETRKPIRPHLPGVARVAPVIAGGLIFTPGFEGSNRSGVQASTPAFDRFRDWRSRSRV